MTQVGPCFSTYCRHQFSKQGKNNFFLSVFVLVKKKKSIGRNIKYSGELGWGRWSAISEEYILLSKKYAIEIFR